MNKDYYWGLIVRLNISADKKCTVDLHPISQCEDSPIIKLLEGESKETALENINSYNALLADEKALSLAWDNYLLSLREDYYSKLIIPSYFMRRVMRKLRLIRFVYPGKWSALLWENLLRCAAHREALVHILSKEQNK
jgi:hypothetical protein